MTDELWPVLKQLRDWLDNDISQIRRTTRTPAPYGAALLITVGCEALSWLLDRDPPHGVFIEEVILHHQKGLDAWMARDIAKALRHGLAHIYDTKLLRIGDVGPEIELVVSWEREEHLSLKKNRDPMGFFLHVPTMWEDLQRVLNGALAMVQEGDGREIPQEWKRQRVFDAGDAALAGWATWLGMEVGRPFPRRESRCTRQK